MEDRIAAQGREIQALILDNQHLAATHVALKQDVFAVQQEVRHLSATASSVKAEKDAQVREVYERYLKLEADARPIEGLYAELDRVRAEVRERIAEREELSAKLNEIEGEIRRDKELQMLSDLKAEIQMMHKEIQRGRDAIEYERKMRSHNLKISEAMEKHLISLTQEAEKLRSELTNVESRAMVAVSAAAVNPGPGYSIHQGNLEPAAHQGTFDPSLSYVPGLVSLAAPTPYDVQGQQIQS